MIKVRELVKRYAFFLLLVLVYAAVLIIKPGLGLQSLALTWQNVLEMLTIVPPIFILLGLLDVWVPREVMIRLTGPGSGLLGVSLAFLLGSFAAGPLFAAFPVAQMMLRKGSKFSNVMILVGAWSTTKIPLLLFEAGSMGWPFMLVRLAFDIPMIFILGLLVEKSLPKNDLKAIYEKAVKS